MMVGKKATDLKKLILLRHAKSSWKDPTLSDFERPLNQRGKKAATLIGEFIRQRPVRPELVICSTAVRARETAALVLESADLAVPVRYETRIYEATYEQLLEVIVEIEENLREVLLIGHNPGMENLLAFLTQVSEPMPTASIARIILQCESWQKVQGGKGDLDWFVTPKELIET